MILIAYFLKYFFALQSNKNNKIGPYGLTIGVTQNMYDELTHLLSVTHFQSMSELCRHIIAGKRVVGRLIDGSPDKLLADLTAIYKELQQKCLSVSRLTQMIYREQNPEALLTCVRKAKQELDDIQDLLDPMYALISSISMRWIHEGEPDV